jgi:hypothetical protein
MITLLSDHDIELYARLLWGEFTTDDWLTLGAAGLVTFSDIGLHRESTDREVWLYCQANRAVLLTGNRNMEDVNSLEAVVRELNDSLSLPIITLPNP